MARRSHSLALLLAIMMAGGCSTDSGTLITPVQVEASSDLPPIEGNTQIERINPGAWPPQFRIRATSHADFGWQNANVRLLAWWGPVASCEEEPPQRLHGQEAEGAYAQGAPPQSVSVLVPTSEVSGGRVKVRTFAYHVFFEGAPYGSYTEHTTSSNSTCIEVDAPGEPGAPPFSASILGPTAIQPAGYCTWTASVAGGNTPYSFEWKRDGQVVSSSSSYTAAVAGGTFWLQLRVTDFYGRLAQANFTVTEDTGGQACMW